MIKSLLLLKDTPIAWQQTKRDAVPSRATAILSYRMVVAVDAKPHSMLLALLASRHNPVQQDL